MTSRSVSVASRALQILKVIAVAAVVGVAISLPQMIPVVHVILAISIMVSILLALSFNLLFGYIGMFSFGQAAFYGLGAYGFGLVINEFEVGFVPALLFVVLLTTIAGLVIGAVLVGLEPIAFIMLTFGVAELLGFWALRWVSVTRGDSGLIVILPLWINLSASPENVYFVVLGISAAVVGILWLILRSPFGLLLRAIRENPARVTTVGVNVWRCRLVTFTIAAVVAGIAGALGGATSQVIYPSMFHWLVSAQALIITLLGGSGYFAGPILGGILMGLIGLYVGRATRNVVAVSGALLLVIILLTPQGVLHLIHQTIDNIFRRQRRDVELAMVTPPEGKSSKVSETRIQ